MLSLLTCNQRAYQTNWTDIKVKKKKKKNSPGPPIKSDFNAQCAVFKKQPKQRFTSSSFNSRLKLLKNHRGSRRTSERTCENLWDSVSFNLWMLSKLKLDFGFQIRLPLELNGQQIKFSSTLGQTGRSLSPQHLIDHFLNPFEIKDSAH